MLAMLCDTLCPISPSWLSVSARGHRFSSSAWSEEWGSWRVRVVLFRLASHVRSKLLYLSSCGCCLNRWCAHHPSSSFSSHWVLFTSCNVWHVLGVLRESEKVCPQGRVAVSFRAAHAVIVTQSCSTTLQSFFKCNNSTNTFQLGGQQDNSLWMLTHL